MGALLIAGMIYLYFSVGIVFFGLFRKRDLNRQPFFGINAAVFYLGTFLGLTYFFMAGFERALFFIPEDWGEHNGYGEWTSIRYFLSLTLGMITSGLITAYLEKIPKERARIQDMENRLGITPESKERARTHPLFRL